MAALLTLAAPAVDVELARSCGRYEIRHGGERWLLDFRTGEHARSRADDPAR